MSVLLIKLSGFCKISFRISAFETGPTVYSTCCFDRILINVLTTCSSDCIETTNFANVIVRKNRLFVIFEQCL